jgi:hypothetical protein
MKSFLKFIGVLILTLLIAAGVYIFRDGTEQAARHYVALVRVFSGKSAPVRPVPTTPKPVPVPVPTPEPKLPIATPAPTPAPVAPQPPAATPVATPDPYDPGLVLESLDKSRDEWPREVALKKRAEFPVIINGAVAGSVDVPAKMAVNFVSFKAGKVIVAFQGATREMTVSDTNLVERVIANRRQGIVPNKPKTPAAATVAATATTTPHKSTLLEEALKPAAPTANVPPDIAELIQEAEALSPTPTKKYEADDYAREQWKEKAKRYMDLPVKYVTAHPGAAQFPGDVPKDAPRVKREFTLPLNRPRWQSTGIYAAPGEKISIHVSSQDAKRGLSVIVGAHRDGIYSHPKWSRFPLLSRTFKITEPHTEVANAFGGLVYIDVPRDKEMGGYHVPTYGGYGWLDENPEKVHGSVHVLIEGGVEAPLYQAGKTTPEQWRKMQQAPAPWGEIASDKIILTLPMNILKSLEDPAPVLAYWDRVIDTEDALVGWPKRVAPPERIVPDREISAGFMHSGYPVMCYVTSAPDLVDLKKLTSEGAWGYYHELGHNHEAQAATFGGDYVEVNVNFCSLYVTEKVVGQDCTRGHNALKDVEKLLSERLGPQKKADAFQNLAMYILPIKALGWEAFHKALASYSEPGGGDGIKTREDKMDQWVLRYSRATGKNLAPYFEAFDVTCNPKTKDLLKDLPVWLPSPDFPKKYTM